MLNQNSSRYCDYGRCFVSPLLRAPSSVVNLEVDRLVDEVDAAIAHQQMCPARMPALVTTSVDNIRRVLDYPGLTIWHPPAGKLNGVSQKCIEGSICGRERKIWAMGALIFAVGGDRLAGHDRVGEPVRNLAQLDSLVPPPEHAGKAWSCVQLGPIGSPATETGFDPRLFPWQHRFLACPPESVQYGQADVEIGRPGGPIPQHHKSPSARFPAGGLVAPPSCFSSVGKRPLGGVSLSLGQISQGNGVAMRG